ncbi:hypothetical protein Taro_050125, partial [Colocasia esculenta]|nr:hypothetical protein [Colocasia esculenta]
TNDHSGRLHPVTSLSPSPSVYIGASRAIRGERKAKRTRPEEAFRPAGRPPVGTAAAMDMGGMDMGHGGGSSGGSMGGGGGNHMSMSYTHMTFFWGKNSEILFKGWPGSRGGMYALALVVVFVLAFLVEWLSHCRLTRAGWPRAAAGVVQTAVHAVRVGLAYLLMLAVMSFNVGVLIVAIAGHAAGFLLFSGAVFGKPGPGESPDAVAGVPAMNPMAMAPGAPDVHMGGGGMPMAFFWGKDAQVLFSGWPGGRLGAYLLAVFLVFALSFLVESLSFAARLLALPRARGEGAAGSPSGSVSAGLAQTAVHAARVALAYLVMLAVMSFNVGVLLAAVAGHATGFFLLGSGIFRRGANEVKH